MSRRKWLAKPRDHQIAPLLITLHTQIYKRRYEYTHNLAVLRLWCPVDLLGLLTACHERLAGIHDADGARPH